MRPTRHFYFLAALVSSMVLLKVGCVSVGGGWGSGPRFEETRTVTVPAARSLDVRTDNGEVTIRRGESPDAVVTARLAARTKERLAETRVVVERQGDGGLLVTVAWPGGRALSNEACAFDIVVPSGTEKVDVTTSNGAVSLVSLSGQAHLRTSNGRIEVTGHRGAVDAQTSNGAIGLSDVVGDVDASTSNGRVEMDAVAGRVVARTSNGAVRVALAQGATGPLELGTTNGAVDVTLPKGFEGRFSLATSNGAVHYPSGAAVHDVTAGKTHAAFAIGGTGQDSKVTTSNGAIEVRIAE
jgi:hypothetical protein